MANDFKRIDGRKELPIQRKDAPKNISQKGLQIVQLIRVNLLVCHPMRVGEKSEESFLGSRATNRWTARYSWLWQLL